MNIDGYYKKFKDKVTENIEKSLDASLGFHSLLTKNRSFLEDYIKWIEILDDAPETYIYKNAAKVYQEALGNMLMGLYQPAFMGLRYFLERTLTGVYYSANELELRTWMNGRRDTYWAELIGREGEDEFSEKEKVKDMNVNIGLFSLKFTRAFFPELENAAKTFRSLTQMVYRNCSEFVHGNPNAINELGKTIDFSESVAAKWNDYADTIARCILYAFMMRYWNFLNDSKKQCVKERLSEEFSATDILKNYIC